MTQSSGTPKLKPKVFSLQDILVGQNIDSVTHTPQAFSVQRSPGSQWFRHLCELPWGLTDVIQDASALLTRIWHFLTDPQTLGAHSIPECPSFSHSLHLSATQPLRPFCGETIGTHAASRTPPPRRDPTSSKIPGTGGIPWLMMDNWLHASLRHLIVFSSPHLDCKLLGVGTIVFTAWFPSLCQGQNYSGWAFNSHLFREGSN